MSKTKYTLRHGGSELLFRTMWDRLNDGIRITDDQGRILMVNQAYCNIIGKGAGEMEGEFLSVAYQDQEGKKILADYRKVFSAKKERRYFEEKFRLWDEREVWLGVSTSFLSLPEEKEVLLCVFRDITTRMEGEEQLRLQSLVLDQIYDNVTVTDMDGIIRFVNKAECRMMNCSAEDLVGRHVSVYGDVPLQSRPKGSIFDYVVKYGQWRGEVYKYSKNGDKIYLDNRISLVYDKTGKPVGVCGVSTDITLRKQSEEVLKESESKLRQQNERLEVLNRELYKSNAKIKEMNAELSEARKRAEDSDRLKTDFLANMSHEIRTPMNGILGFTNLLKNQDIKPDKKELYLDVIEQSGQRMLGILNNIIDISKIEAGLLEVANEPVDLNQLLREQHEFFRQEAAIKGLRLNLKTGVPDGKCRLLTDRQKLEQIISNLLKNAVKFTDEGKIDFGYRITGTNAEIFVRDTGCGIDEGDRERVFERFWRVKDPVVKRSEGTGLGLPIAKSLAELLGGDIRLESEKGRGSAFYVTLPLHESIGAENNKPEEEPSDYLLLPADLKVLIAEDDEFSAEYLKAILEPYVKEFLIVGNGFEAVEICKNHTDINMILMDIKLPGIDGIEATIRIRNFNTEIPIVAQTAFALEGDRNKVILAGCNEYLAKPVKEKELLNLMIKLINR